MSYFNYDVMTLVNFVEGVIMPSLQSIVETSVGPDEEDFVVVPKATTRAVARYNARQYSQELRAMGYRAPANSKAKGFKGWR